MWTWGSCWSKESSWNVVVEGAGDLIFCRDYETGSVMCAEQELIELKMAEFDAPGLWWNLVWITIDVCTSQMILRRMPFQYSCWWLSWQVSELVPSTITQIVVFLKLLKPSIIKLDDSTCPRGSAHYAFRLFIAMYFIRLQREWKWCWTRHTYFWCLRIRLDASLFVQGACLKSTLVVKQGVRNCYGWCSLIVYFDLLIDQ